MADEKEVKTVLSVVYGSCEEAIYNTAVYFKNMFQDSWLESDLAKRMIKSVDKSIVIGPRLIESKILGPISPVDLSGGVKTLLLVLNCPDKIFNASTCGDNCASWLLKLGRERDVTINLRHLMDFGNGRFTIRIANTGDIVHTMSDLVSIAGELLYQERQ